VRVLIVEDDHELAEVLEHGLREQHIEAMVAPTPAEARERASLGAYDVIVLDVLIPGGNGYDLCAEFRRQGQTTPILMLTARDAVDDRVRGLDEGADDYHTKPIAFRELLARIRALGRRQPGIAPSVHGTADLEIDFHSRRKRHPAHREGVRLARVPGAARGAGGGPRDHHRVCVGREP
jgi:DNA-binding response OmpR family regulator